MAVPIINAHGTVLAFEGGRVLPLYAFSNDLLSVVDANVCLSL